MLGTASYSFEFGKLAKVSYRNLLEVIDDADHTLLRRIDRSRQFRVDACVVSLNGFAEIVDRHLLQNRVCLQQPVQPVNAGIQVVHDGVEITVKTAGNLGRDLALCHASRTLGGHLQRADHGIQNPVQRIHNPAFATLERIGAHPLREAALLEGGGHPQDLCLKAPPLRHVHGTRCWTT